MRLEEAIAAVKATLDSEHLLVDRRLAREDAESFLLLVLDISNGRNDGDGPVSNGPRLVDKSTGEVVRLTVPAAGERARSMVLSAGGQQDQAGSVGGGSEVNAQPPSVVADLG
jgi:hypothetical protein